MWKTKRTTRTVFPAVAYSASAACHLGPSCPGIFLESRGETPQRRPPSRRGSPVPQLRHVESLQSMDASPGAVRNPRHPLNPNIIRSPQQFVGYGAWSWSLGNPPATSLTSSTGSSSLQSRFSQSTQGSVLRPQMRPSSSGHPQYPPGHPLRGSHSCPVCHAAPVFDANAFNGTCSASCQAMRLLS